MLAAERVDDHPLALTVGRVERLGSAVHRLDDAAFSAAKLRPSAAEVRPVTLVEELVLADRRRAGPPVWPSSMPTGVWTAPSKKRVRSSWRSAHRRRARSGRALPQRLLPRAITPPPCVRLGPGSARARDVQRPAVRAGDAPGSRSRCR